MTIPLRSWVDRKPDSAKKEDKSETAVDGDETPVGVDSRKDTNSPSDGEAGRTRGEELMAEGPVPR